MTESQFKQWFTGFVEGIEGKAPTAKQWAKIKERVDQITGTPVVERYFYDRYWTPYYSGPYWSVHTGTGMCYNPPAAGENAMSLSQSGAGEWIAQAQAIAQNYAGNEGLSYEPAFDAEDAMYALGRADAMAET